MELGSYLDELDTRLADEVVFPGCRMEGIHCEGGGGNFSDTLCATKKIVATKLII